MDANVIRTLNQGPMGPQGPVAVNHCIMNQEAGFGPVCRIYSHKFEEAAAEEGEEEEEGDPEPGPIEDLGEDIDDLDEIDAGPSDNPPPVDDDLDDLSPIDPVADEQVDDEDRG